jgi:hypothetical protein
VAKATINLTVEHLPYGEHLAHNLNAGLSQNLNDNAQHALYCSIPEGRHPRLVDFSVWENLGASSHRTTGINAQNIDVAGALSVAAFQIGDSGGFLGAMPRDNLEWPIYYFMTHAAVAFESAYKPSGRRAAEWFKSMPSELYLYLTGASSQHAALIGYKQLELLLSTIFPPIQGDVIEYKFTQA